MRADRPNTVVGYYTLAGAVAFGNVPEQIARKLPRHPVPVVLLARLAVDRSVQSRGLGKALLVDALQCAVGISKFLGIAVEVVAIDEQAAGFYTYFGFTPLLDNPRHMYLPISAIEEAIAASEQEDERSRFL